MKKYSNTGKKIVIKLIRFYKVALSPYKGRSYCNYVPSCSQYAIEAIDMYGVVLGGWLAFKRILRCNKGLFSNCYPGYYVYYFDCEGKQCGFTDRTDISGCSFF